MEKSERAMYAEIIAEQLHISEKEAAEKIRQARREYHIPVKYYANHRVYLLEDEAKLRFHSEKVERDRQKLAKRLAEITDRTEEEAAEYLLHLRETYQIGGKVALNNQLYTMSEEEIAAWKEQTDATNAARVQRIAKITGWNEYEVKKHMAKCKAVFGIATENYENTRCFELTDETLATFANLEDSRMLAERYVSPDCVDILKNKQLFNETYREFLGRKFWVNRDCDYSSFKKFMGLRRDVFCKPLDLAGGKGVYRKTIPFSEREAAYEFFIKEPKMIVEQVIKQHPAMNGFYKDSVNTIRIFTILKDGEFDAFAAFVRFGVRGVIDNVSSGGIACGVDTKTGKIITPALGEDGISYTKHPVTGKRFEGFQIPRWKECLALTERALRKVEGIHYVGWDVALTRRGPVLVEGNNIPDLSIYQSLFAYRGEGRRFIYEKYL